MIFGLKPISPVTRVIGKIGVRSKHSMIFMFGPHFICTSTIMASYILNPVLAYVPCSGVSHVKFRLLPKDFLTLADMSTAIGISSIMSRDIYEFLPEDMPSAL